MTYKALRRKSDKHYARVDIDDAGIYDIPVPFIMDEIYLRSVMTLYPKLEWNDYELVEVAVICLEDMPTLQECANYGIKKYEDNHKATYWLQGIKWFADKVKLHL